MTKDFFLNYVMLSAAIATGIVVGAAGVVLGAAITYSYNQGRIYAVPGSASNGTQDG